jgi:Asp-tRNA(Asn)/Glu-tRNA(Gln) amidotransferase A subunit family amidase
MDTGTQPDASFEYRTTKELVAALQARKISAVELTDHVIARIEAHDAKINAVVVRDFDRGRAAAKTADAAMSRGERRPLLGIPMVIKESFDVAGLRTTWGIPAFRDYVPMEDAIMVARVKAAGAIILGKTNVPLMLGDWQSYNDIYGTTNNPWDLNRSPGGSSGGSSAALAAGFGPLSLGSDIGGSLRTPAHYCGVYAHKPTLNLLPPRGHAIPGTTPREADLAVVGPMARSAADLDLLLEVTAGPDEARAGIAYRLALPPARHNALKAYRVLVINDHPSLPTAASVRTALDRLAQRLVKAGVTVAHASPLLPDLVDSAKLFMSLLMNKILVLELASSEYVIRRENIIAVGNSGTGKTHVCLGLGLAACQKGLSVGFNTAAALVHELLEARDEKRLLRLQRQLAGYKLLIIDELGYVPLSQTGAELLFEVFSQRYERGSTVVTSNLPFDEWTSVFGSERLTGALLDRLTHHVHILEMNGDSYRLNQSKRRSRRASADASVDNPTQA